MFELLGVPFIRDMYAKPAFATLIVIFAALAAVSLLTSDEGHPPSPRSDCLADGVDAVPPGYVHGLEDLAEFIWNQLQVIPETVRSPSGIDTQRGAATTDAAATAASSDGQPSGSTGACQ